MAQRTATVGSKQGFHARPAKAFVQAVAHSGASVQLSDATGRTVDAGSILGLISLGLKHGDEIVLSTDGPDADAVLEGLAQIVAIDHDA
jgi:phosphocarrier protein HPr